ncbi:MAG: 8-oxo-dGTP diphosphatase [Pseudohongiellaceae bacterium]|jgi:8-oxo-dGTP diphosphatase
MPSKQKLVHVAVGVVKNDLNQVLISLRRSDADQGGLWEFPGGKVDPGEDVRSALCREFKEELGINPTRFFPLKKILHQYSDKKVLLDVWTITSFDGEPQGLEGQEIKWQLAEMFNYDEFPKANRQIIDVLRLPLYLPITPQVPNFKALESLILNWIEAKCPLAYFRQSQLSDDLYRQWFVCANQLCLNSGLVLLADLEKYLCEDGSGVRSVHAEASTLMRLEARPVAEDVLFSASCHNQEELIHAQNVGVDFVLLAPAAKYESAKSSFWAAFESLVETASIPTYGLRGLSKADMSQALLSGAVGTAGISTISKLSS